MKLDSCFHCQGPGLNSWVGNWRSCQLQRMARKKKFKLSHSDIKSVFLISVSCLSREKWHWSWDIIKRKQRKNWKLQKKDSHEKPSWRKSSRTVSVTELSLVSLFLYYGMFPGIWAFNMDYLYVTSTISFFELEF